MRFLAILTLLLVAFAGCSDRGDDEPAETTTTSTTQTTTSTQTTTTRTTSSAPSEPGEPEANQAPTGTLSASITQGEVPVDVAFTFEGSDPDGDALSWTFDANGDGTFEAEGTELPAAYNHSYADTGSYLANFTLSDGDLSTSYEVTINATAAAEAAPDFSTIVISGTISGLYVAEPVVTGAGPGYITDPNVHEFEVPGVASAIDFLLEWGDMALDLDFEVFAVDGSEVAGAANYNDPVIGDGAASESAQVTDAAALSQVGTWTVEVLSAGSYEADYTVTVTFTA